MKRYLVAPLLALAACDTPLGPLAGGGGTAADQAFGAAHVRWFIPDPVGGWTMHPALAGPYVYFERDLHLSSTGAVLDRAQLVALDRETSAEVWAQPIVTGENAVVAGDVIGAMWGSLPMFHRLTGAPLPVFRYGQQSLSGNAATNGTHFYLLTHDGHALALDPGAGTPRWDTDLAGANSATGFGVAVADGVLAVTLKHFGSAAAPGNSGIVAVLDARTGAVRWRAAVGDGHDPGITDPPVIIGDRVVTRGGSDVRAWDLRTGAPRWRFDARGSGVQYSGSGLASCEGLVISPTGDLRIAALDAVTGSVRWKAAAQDLGSLMSLECSHGTVLARGSGLAVYDARDGARRARYPIRDPYDGRREFMIAAATRDAGFLYISTTYGYVKVDAPGG